MRHLPRVRGSPLLRSILILLALAASGLALVRLTNSQSAAPVSVTKNLPPTAAISAIPYRLALSAEAAEISISADSQPPLNQTSGSLTAASKNPVISLTVRWKNPPAPDEQRFAKLTLDPPGKPTITHVFDAADDIDDLLELP